MASTMLRYGRNLTVGLGRNAAVWNRPIFSQERALSTAKFIQSSNAHSKKEPLVNQKPRINTNYILPIKDPRYTFQLKHTNMPKNMVDEIISISLDYLKLNEINTGKDATYYRYQDNIAQRKCQNAESQISKHCRKKYQKWYRFLPDALGSQHWQCLISHKDNTSYPPFITRLSMPGQMFDGAQYFMHYTVHGSEELDENFKRRDDEDFCVFIFRGTIFWQQDQLMSVKAF